MKIALVYDRVNKLGGAERILTALHELYPQAPLFTLVYDPHRAAWAKDFRIIPSFLQHVPYAKSQHEFFPIIPVFAFEKFDFSGFDMVVSITSAEAKGIITPPKVFHLCYCLTPTRYLWSHYWDYFPRRLWRKLSLPFISQLRIWDTLAARRPDSYIVISETVRQRIAKYYHREASVIYPPVETQKFKIPAFAKASSFVKTSEDKSSGRQNSHPKDGQPWAEKLKIKQNAEYFLIVSRLVGYKRIDIAIEACNRLRFPLKIIGIGLEEKRLRRLAGPTVEFLGSLTDEELGVYYQDCQALIFPQEEDFGITAVEALAYGKPVIAYKKGGATEIIQEGIHGEFFYPQTSVKLVEALEKFAQKKYSALLCQKRAEMFSTEKFKQNFANLVKQMYADYRQAKYL